MMAGGDEEQVFSMFHHFERFPYCSFFGHNNTDCYCCYKFLDFKLEKYQKIQIYFFLKKHFCEMLCRLL